MTNNIFENPFFKIIQKAKAQGTNIASPTLPVDTTSLQPQETLTPTPPTTDKVTASLINASTDIVKLNTEFKINLAITSGEEKVQSFSITIIYDPKKFKYNSKSFLSTDFQTNENIIVNESKSTIVVKGTAQDAVEAINSNVAYIEFLPIDEGSTTITISNTNLDSEILNEQGVNILAEVSNLDLMINEQSATSIPSNTASITSTKIPSNLPKGDLDLSTLTQFTPYATGIIVLIIGLWLKKLVSEKEE